MKKKVKIIAFLLIIAITLNIKIGEVEAANTKTETITLNWFELHTRAEIYDSHGGTRANSRNILYKGFNLLDYLDIKEETNVHITGNVKWDTVTSYNNPFKIYLNVLNWGDSTNVRDYLPSGERSFNFNVMNYSYNSSYFIIEVQPTLDGGYASPRVWGVQTRADIALTVTYTPNNNQPVLTIVTPTPNSPLQGRQTYEKGAA
mgnify:CR=1 FL=1